MTAPRIRLVTRADDMGLLTCVNDATEEAFRNGIIRNISLMPCVPAFDDAVERLRRLPGACIGLHATLGCEWEAPRWGTLLPPERVPSLVQPDGTMVRGTHDLDRKPAPQTEMLAEIAAQYAKVMATGLPIAYMDAHMAFGWLDEYATARWMQEFCRQHGLLHCACPAPLGDQPQGLPRVEGEFSSPARRFIAQLEAAQPGVYVWVTHLGRDVPEMRALDGKGRVAAERDADRRMCSDPELLAYCRENGVAFIRYDEMG